MKIGILSKVAERSDTGPGNIMYNLIKKVHELNEEHEIVLIHPTPSDHELYDQYDHVQVSNNPVKAALELRKHDFDLLHFHCISTREAYVYPLLLDTVNITTQYGDEHFADLAVCPQPRMTVYRKRLAQPLLARFFKTIMPLSESAKNNLASGGIPREKMTVVNPGLDETFWDVPNVEREDFLFHASNQSIRKNTEVFLQSYEHLRANGYENKLVIAGMDWSEEVLGRYLDNPETKQHIELIGHVSPEDLKKYYASCVVYLAPTLQEGFGLTAVEAMACGAPVVSHNVYAVPEAMGDAGILVDDVDSPEAFAKAVQSLLDDPQRRSELSDKGKKHAQSFTWEKSARKVLDIYDSYAQ